MALRNVVVKGDELLGRKCREVTEINERITTLLDDMLETMRVEAGVGIAAPQVGVARRMCIIEPEEGNYTELINPEILEQKGSCVSTEGCLSVPGLIGEVDRPEYVRVRYMNRNGETIEEEFEGFPAIVVSHETDHLDGILFVDKARNIRTVEEE